MLSCASPGRLFYLHRLAVDSSWSPALLRVCRLFCCTKTSTYILDCKGWVSIAPFPPPPLLRSIDRLSGFHDKLHAFHVALMHAPSQFFAENDGRYQTRRGQHGMAAPVAAPSVSSSVGGALRTQYPYKAACESESIYLSYLPPQRQGTRQK